MKNFRWFLLILLFLNGALTVTSQEKKVKSSDSDILAPLEDVKKKSDAEENVAYNDPSFLEGFQIRPSHSFLKTRQSQLLKVSDCFRPSFAGEDDLVSLQTECDPTGMGLAPLLRIAKTSNWSVNGIKGGNDNVGKIVMNSQNTATYTAPAKKPTSETVQVSAEIQEEGKSKIIVVATIIILDDLRVYYGTVEIECTTPDVNYRAFGVILFKESGQNSDSFTSIGGSLSYFYSAKDCVPAKGILPLFGELGLWTEEEDKIMAGGNTHGISFFTDPFNISCNGITIPNAVFSIITTCDEKKNASSDIDFREVWGEGRCSTVRIKWNLTKQ